MEMERKHTLNRNWKLFGVLIIIIIFIAVNITVMQSKKNTTSTSLQFAKVQMKELSNTKLIAGQIVPGKMETFFPDSTKGKVKEIYVKEGQKITKGQKLFSYNNPDLSNQLEQLDIDKKTTDLQMNQENQKITSLQKQIKDAKNANATQDVINQLNSQLQDLQFQQQTTQLTIKKNQLQEEDLQNKIDNLIVYSNIDGIVQQANTDAGAGQSETQTAAQTTPIILIASLDPFIIQGTMTELQKAQIQPNQPITVTAKAISNKTWKGKISEISDYPSTDGLGQSTAVNGTQQTQTISYYAYKAVLDSQDGLSPGYHVSVQVNISSKKVLVIPSSSIVENGNSRYVYVVSNNKLHKTTITTGLGDGNSTEVLQGLKAGNRIVNNPSANVYDGMNVSTK